MRNAFQFTARAAAAFLLVSISCVAVAAGSQPFDAAAFKAAQVAGKPIVVEIHADWCPECKAQNRVLDRLDNEPRYARMVRLRIDYDGQKNLVKQFKARQQSTLIVYKGDKELARAVGITGEDQIRALVDKAI
jgi:thioredoxin-like negative regulator of GroEL